tara:strand:+ start:465 stop:923 length:459 start_codon:yes stop_codon:yes gene_type:complete
MNIGTLCYIKKNNQTLMLHRVKKENDMHKNKWNGLGGKLIPGESPEECVIREIKEESGLNIKTPILKGIITFPKFDDIEDWLVFVFTANQFSGNLIDSDEGNLKWIDDSDLLNLNMWEGDRIFIPWLGKNKLFSAKFHYSNNNYIKHEVIFY